MSPKSDPEVLRIFPFRYKLTALIAVIVVLVLTAIFAVVRARLEDEFRNLVLKQLEQTDRYISDQMDMRYENLLSVAAAVSDDKLVLDVLTDRNLSVETRNDIIASEVLEALINVDSLTLLDDTGQLLGHGMDSDAKAKASWESMMGSPWFDDLLSGEPSAGFIYLDGSYLQCVGNPVFIGETMVGILVVSRVLTTQQLLGVKQASGADILVLRNGEIVSSTLSDPDGTAEMQQPLLQALKHWLAVSSAATKQEHPAAQATEVRLLGERYLLRGFGTSRGIMPPYLVLQSLDRPLRFLADLRMSAIAIGLVGILAGISLGFLMALAISRPIRILRAATREVERENLDHRVSIRTRDEFAELGRSFNEMIEGLDEKRRIRSAFDKSVSREVADHILSAGAVLGGERRVATVLFLDIWSFTSLSEKLPPESLIALLNAFFTRLNACIHSHRGIVDKYMGDAVMAIFGAPVTREQHALDAVRASQDMLGTLRSFNAEVASRYGCQLDIGIGINTGNVIAGLVGSDDRLSYTVVGDDVNLASRLEGLTRIYSAGTILGEATVEELARASPEGYRDLRLRELDRVQVKGRVTPVRVYELLPRSGPLAELAPQLALFQQARSRIHERDFSGAVVLFQSVLSASPGDAVARTFLERCQRYAIEPDRYESEYRDGVRVLSAK